MRVDGNGVAPQFWQMESDLSKKGVLFFYEKVYQRGTLSFVKYGI